MSTAITPPPSLYAQELTQRVHDGGLPGYGVRWDDRKQIWRVRNELTGQWCLTEGGSVDGWKHFEAANAAHRQHQPPSRGFGW